MKRRIRCAISWAVIAMLVALANDLDLRFSHNPWLKLPPSAAAGPDRIIGDLHLTECDKLFGVVQLLPSQIVASDWPLAATALRADDLDEINVAAENDIQIVLTHLDRNHMADANGCFSLSALRQSLNAYIDPVALAPYIADGTIVGFMPIDEPHDWHPDCGPTHAELNQICAHIHQQVPGLRCGYNARFDWLESSDDEFSDLDFIATQYNPARHGTDVQAWLTYQNTHSTWFPGPRWYLLSTVNDTLLLSDIENYGIALCQSPAEAVFIVRWGSIFEQSDDQGVIAAIAGACTCQE